MPIQSILTSGPQSRSSSFADNLRAKDKPLVYFLTITFGPSQGGGTAWYVFQPEPAKAKRFLKLFEVNDAFAFADYGEVLHTEWGEEPDEAMKDYLRETYGLFDQ